MMDGVSTRTRSKIIGVSGRTRSKNVPLFGCLSLHGSSSKRRKNVGNDKGLDPVSVSGSKRMRVKKEPFVMIDGVSSRTRSKNVPLLFDCLSLDGSSLKRRKSDEDDMGLESVSGSKDRKVNEGVISIHADEDVEGLEQYDEKKIEGDVDVNKEVKSDESGEIDAKDGNFVDEKCDLESENPITISVGGVSSRTRSKKVSLSGCLSLDGFGKMRVKGEAFVDLENDKVISIHVDEDEEGLEQCDEKMFEGGVVDVVKEVKSDEITDKDENFIDENFSDESDDEEMSDDVDDDDDMEGSEQCDEMFEGCVDVEKDVKIDESGGICEIPDKDGNFVDEKCDLELENPITTSVGGVSSRTRSKNVPLFGCLSLDSLSSKRRKNDKDEMALISVSGSGKMRVNGEVLVVPENDKVISIHDDDDVDDEDEKGSEQCDEKMFEGCVDVEKEVKIDESGGICEIANKNGNFVDEKCGLVPENPITVSVAGVSSRTRSKNVPLFGCLSLDSLSSKRRKNDKDEMALISVSGSGKMRVNGEVLVVPENDRVISIHDDNDVDDEDEKGLQQCGEKMLEGVVDVIKEVKSDESGEIAHKDENFVDEKFSDESGESDDEELVDVDSGDDDDDEEEDESEENETSDEDFRVDEDDDDDDVEGEEEEEEVEKKRGWRKYYNVDDGTEEEGEEDMEKLWQERAMMEKELLKDKKSGISEKNNEEVKIESSPFSINNDGLKMVCFDPMKSSSNLNKLSEKSNSKSVGIINMQNVSDEDDVQVIADRPKSVDSSKLHKGETNNGEEEEEKVWRKYDVVKEDEEEGMKKLWQEYDSVLEEVKDKKNGISEKNSENKTSKKRKSKSVDINMQNLCDDVQVIADHPKSFGSSKLHNGETNNGEEKVWRKYDVVEEDEEEAMKRLWQEYDSVLEDVNDTKNGISGKNTENKTSKKRESKSADINMQNVCDDVQVIADHPKSFGSSKLHKGETNNGEEEEEEKVWRKYDMVEEDEEEEMKKLWQEYDSVVEDVNDKRNGISEKNTENKTSKKRESKSVDIKMQNVCDDVQVIAYHPKSFGSSKLHKGETNNAKAKAKDYVKANDIVNVDDCYEGKHVKGLGVEGVSLFQAKQEKKRFSDAQKMPENKGRDYKGRVSIWNGEKKATMENSGLNRRVNSTLFMRKELRLAKLLAECYLGDKNDNMNNDPILLEIKDDTIDRRDTWPPPVCVETPSLIWSLKKVEKVEKTKEEEEQEMLWDQVDTSLRELEAESMIGSLGTNEVKEENMGNSSTLCEHDTRLDDEIGVYCRWCGVVITEIKYISPLVVDRFPYEGSGKRTSFDDSVNTSLFDGSQFDVSGDESMPNFSYNGGTVWDLIPGVKQTLYPHQQEGFEFIWKNLAGNIRLRKLKNADPRREGGCIISHAPGTGKTRLTIMFLMAYMRVFPKCFPVIVAPAGMLLTWEDEFKKWDIGVPFHNLNSSELSGKEHGDAVNWSNTRQSKDEIRMVKLISWFKEKSILGISYALYKILAGGGGEFKDKKKHADVEKRKENDVMRKVLLEVPRLLVLDEGHTPRNRRSNIWKVLSEVQARKRIILSGTPFQNNLLELYNTFSLVKPSFPNTIPHELKKFCERKNASKEWSWEADCGDSTQWSNPSDVKIKQLKMLMDPFVHVHKGAILQKKLPGLRDCVLILKPDSLQKQIIESIQSDQNILIFERKQTMASVHPSLLLQCKLLEEEESVVDKDRLEKQWLNLYLGVKTKFLLEFVKLCDAYNEKVLVFSQFLNTLSLIEYQLNSVFKWTQGKEILYLDGNVDLTEKQSRIHSFNDANCQAKIMLASTRACSEGISLVGASRVVLLDVVWNPSVERQAISRAYRIGQKKVVYTYHLLTQGTAEYAKYCKQSHKDRLSELVFTAKNADNDDESKSCPVNIEDRILDQMMQHEKLKDMFVKCVVQPKEQDLVDSFGY